MRRFCLLSTWDVHTLQVEIPAQDANVVRRLLTDCDIAIALQPTVMEEEFHALTPFAKLPYCPSIGKKKSNMYRDRLCLTLTGSC